jgi:hypothetical protein
MDRREHPARTFRFEVHHPSRCQQEEHGENHGFNCSILLITIIFVQMLPLAFIYAAVFPWVEYW